jgi:hypothetical protein
VSEQKLIYFLYSRFPGLWHKWTLAVLATGRRDADHYIKAVYRGGTYAGKVEGGTVNADCGAVTEAAQAVLHTKNEKLYGATE